MATKLKFHTEQFEIEGFIKTDTRAFTIINKGNTVAVIENEPFNPREGVEIAGDTGDVIVNELRLRFELVPGFDYNATPAANKVFVRRLVK